MLSGLLVIPGVSTLPCLPLMLSLKTIILKYVLVCVFLVSPCCVHRDRRPDQTVSVVPSPRFVLFVFSSVSLYPVFLSLMLAGLPSRGSREFTPPFAALPSRCSREFSPPFAAQPSRRSRELTPPFAALPSRRSREFTPPFADQPALSSLEMTPPSTANPSPPACLWLNARRPASDSMPAGLPLIPARQECRWLKLAGLPLTQARRIAADSCHWSSAGKANAPPLCFTPPSAAHQCFTCFFYVGKANPPSAVHSARSRLRLPPARRPLPLSGQASRLLPLLSSQPIMVSPAGRCRIDKPAGRGRNWPVSDHGLFNCFSMFAPEGSWYP